MEGFRHMIKNMSKNFDIIDSRNLLDLINTGKIEINHTEDLSQTIYIPPVANKKSATQKVLSQKDKYKDKEVNI